MTQPRKSQRSSNELKDFFGELEAPNKRFLKEDEKQQLADEQIPFNVQALDFTPSKQYGDRWELTITRSDGDDWPFENTDDMRVILTMPSHGARDHIMRKLEKALGTGSVVGPLILTIAEIDNDQTWLALAKAPVK